MFTIYPWEGEGGGGGRKILAGSLGGHWSFKIVGEGHHERFPMSRAPKSGPSCSKAD